MLVLCRLAVKHNSTHTTQLLYSEAVLSGNNKFKKAQLVEQVDAGLHYLKQTTCFVSVTDILQTNYKNNTTENN